MRCENRTRSTRRCARSWKGSWLRRTWWVWEGLGKELLKRAKETKSTPAMSMIAAKSSKTHLLCANISWPTERGSTFALWKAAARGSWTIQSLKDINWYIQVRNLSNVNYAVNVSLWISIWEHIFERILARNLTFALILAAISVLPKVLIWQPMRKLTWIKTALSGILEAVLVFIFWITIKDKNKE